MADNKMLENEEKKTQTPVEDNVIKETTGSEVEIYDEDSSVDLSDSEKPKKKFKIKKKWIVLGVVLLLIAFFIVRGMLAAKNNIATVETYAMENGDIENILSVSGTVESAENITYFSDVTAPIEKLNVKVGDKVKKGDVLYTYDEHELDLAQKTAELAITQAQGTYNSMYSGTAAADRKYAQGMNAQQINDRLDAITAEIDDLNNRITEKTNRINQTLKDIQNTQLDVNQNGIQDSYEGYFEEGSDSYIDRKEDDNNEHEASDSNRQMILAMNQTYNDVSYALKTDGEIKAWNDRITQLKEEQGHLSSAKASLVNPGTAQSSKAQLETAELSNEDTIAKVEEAKEGIKADFNAVVTEVAAVDGATVAKGSKVVSLSNLEDVQVAVQISKSDLPKIALGQKVDVTINNKPYNGEITKISGTATKNNNGVAVVSTIIKITNPDDDIILGVEANNKIHAEKAENTLVIPYEYVQTDADGDYVYVVENGTVARRNVQVGIASSTQAQITEGLKEGDEVISSDVSLLTEGMPVLTQNMTTGE